VRPALPGPEAGRHSVDPTIPFHPRRVLRCGRSNVGDGDWGSPSVGTPGGGARPTTHPIRRCRGSPSPLRRLCNRPQVPIASAAMPRVALGQDNGEDPPMQTTRRRHRRLRCGGVVWTVWAIALLLAGCAHPTADAPSHAGSRRTVRVFLVAGQSNAVGYNDTKDYHGGRDPFPESLRLQPDVCSGRAPSSRPMPRVWRGGP
jgi:hypothetical protein